MTLIKIRKVISGMVLILFGLLFLDVEPLSVLLSEILPPFQFVPALMRAVTTPAMLYIAGLIFIVFITLIFGRVYCSFLCPLGTMQDLVIACSRRIGLQQRHSYRRPLNVLRLALLALTAFAALTGSLSLVSLFDPYSLAGRIFTNLLHPLLTHTYNLGIVVFRPFDIYGYPKQTAFVPLSVLTITAVFFLLLLYLAATRGRLYCNSICPVGTLLGLIAYRSVFQLTVDRPACRGCAQCENICKAGCIDWQTASIDMSRCVTCFNCLSACEQAGISFRQRRGKSGTDAWSSVRRGLIIGSVAATASVLVAFNANIRAFLNIRAAGANPPVTPPGSLNTTRFTQACTSCSLCVSVCPTKVLTPSVMDFGLSGLLQPKMNYEKSYCDYECNLCGQVCPTGAILPIRLDEKKLTQIGEAKLLKDVCVVHVRHQNCGACGEVCPTHAIRFTDQKNILYPEIDGQYCIGCGACQLACPTTPRSIVVHANPIHKKAITYLLLETPAGQKKPSDKDFPF